MGFGPSQVLLPCSGTARPGQAGGGGASTEQQTRPPDAAPRSFLLFEDTLISRLALPSKGRLRHLETHNCIFHA